MVPVIKWLEGDPSLGRGSTDGFRPIELENEIGFRFYGWQYHDESELRTEMRFVFQHACSDGKGAFSFVEDVLCHYKLLIDGNGKPGDAALSFDCERILDRDQRPEAGGLAGRIWRTLVVRPKRAINMLFTRPLSLSSTEGDEVDEGELIEPPRQCSITLSREVTEELGRLANSVGATTNLVLVRELFHILGDCVERSEGKSASASASGTKGDLLRLLIPFSLRNETHRRMPAANCVSMAYLEAKRNSLVDDDGENRTLLKDLIKQMAFIRKWQLQFSWAESIESYARLWPVIKLFKRKKESGGQNSRQIATAVLTNLGRVFSRGLLPTSDGKIQIGSLEVETAHLVVPCTAKQNVNFSVNFYGDRLTIEVSYLPSKVTVESAQRILDSWRARVVEVARESSAEFEVRNSKCGN